MYTFVGLKGNMRLIAAGFEHRSPLPTPKTFCLMGTVGGAKADAGAI